MAADEKESHAREFTDIERTTLRVWFDVDLAGDDRLADEILDAGLQYEHYTSLLADDFDARTTGQIAKQAQLAAKLVDALDRAREFLAGKGHDRADRAGSLADEMRRLRDRQGPEGG